MNWGEIYLSVEDLKKLMGSYSQEYARNKHKKIRDELGKSDGSLTIGDYCRYSGDNYEEIYIFLRGKRPPQVPSEFSSAD